VISLRNSVRLPFQSIQILFHLETNCRMVDTHILLVDGSGGKDDGDNNSWIYNDTVAFYQLFRSYGYSPDIITSRPPPSKVLLYGNPPTIFYHPDDETAPTSTWTALRYPLYLQQRTNHPLLRHHQATRKYLLCRRTVQLHILLPKFL
jgi:hypothetical protein